MLINAHQPFRSVSLSALRKKMRTPVLVDIKNFFPRAEAEACGFHVVNL
ncbi:MAG: hypothetical protein PHG65_13325 [Kiritimatiellae bacterium]|nr:hypothetical protein [Kiritimatiellia bacterium]